MVAGNPVLVAGDQPSKGQQIAAEAAGIVSVVDPALAPLAAAAVQVEPTAEFLVRLILAAFHHGHKVGSQQATAKPAS